MTIYIWSCHHIQSDLPYGLNVGLYNWYGRGKWLLGMAFGHTPGKSKEQLKMRL